MFEVKFYVGMEFDKTGERLSSQDIITYRKDSEKLLSINYGGFTAFNGIGLDSSIVGTVDEVTRLFVVIVDEADSEERTVIQNAAYTAESLKALCRQRSVLYTVSKVSGGFV